MSNKPLKIVLLYLSISVAWIVLSDRLVNLISSFTAIQLSVLQTSKGVFFVLITGLLLYFNIKKHQKSLLNSEKQYKSLFYANPNPIWIYDVETLRFLAVNDAAIRKYGYSRQEFHQLTIQDIRPQEDHEKVQKSAKNLPDEFHASGYWQHIKKNGKLFTVSVKSHKIKFNDRDCAMVMALDVTARLNQEEKLKSLYTIEKELREELEKNIGLIQQSLEDKQRLAEVVDRVHNMVVITDKCGVITWVNQAFINFTGYALEEVKGKSSHFLHGTNTDPATQVQIMESLQKNEFRSFEIVNYTKNGEEYWVELTISAIHNQENEVERYISVQNIITERKEREEMIKAQNQALRKMAWTNSHALRKPVASILSLVGLCKDSQHIEEIKEMHSLIEVCTADLDEVIKEISREINRCEAKDHYS
ncbi:PAS domain S-box protein [Rubrolithibacter danxiaensis]|uniref:PAS domain S-box protein n=1 Tax=Rubrolithibacter danxiaensis TaxID=3390805 RepID=UPI003BF9010B